MSSGATVTPSWAASFAWYFVSMSRSRVVAGSDWRCWAIVDCSDVPWASVRWPAATAVRDPGLRLVETPGLDLVAVGELVLGDRLAVDAADRREMRRCTRTVPPRWRG